MAIGANDSLNNFISKAGGQLSFGNRFRRARQPKGANFHTGYYYGPEEGGPPPVTEGGILSSRELNDPNIDFSRSTYLSERVSKSEVSNLTGTPAENEDPVLYGFEVIIDENSSPLLNGEMEEFINQFGGSNEEIRSRLEILARFKNSLSRFFRWNASPPEFTENRRFHYVKKIEGLEKLYEKNDAKKSNSFVNYREDVLKIHFYEDTTLTTGQLISLYKLLYWSRIRGKGVIPENLLRFDCQIIISEVRNFERVIDAVEEIDELSIEENGLDRRISKLLKKRDSGGLTSRQEKRLDRLSQRRTGQIMEDLENSPEDLLQVIKDNVSRYVYNVYECQFFFTKMTHPGEIDLESTPSPSENTSVDISFKFSDMRFEKFQYDSVYGKYIYLSNRQLNPLLPSSRDPNTNVNTSSGSISVTQNGSFPKPKGVKIRSSNFKRKPAEGSALGNLLKGVKKAALSEAQRKLNQEFRLLNNAIDKVRDSFGLGRMSAPTNVYQIPNNGSRFFFDVQNSLRNFVGESLNNTLFGGNT